MAKLTKLQKKSQKLKTKFSTEIKNLTRRNVLSARIYLALTLALSEKSKANYNLVVLKMLQIFTTSVCNGKKIINKQG